MSVLLSFAQLKQHAFVCSQRFVFRVSFNIPPMIIIITFGVTKYEKFSYKFNFRVTLKPYIPTNHKIIKFILIIPSDSVERVFS